MSRDSLGQAHYHGKDASSAEFRCLAMERLLDLHVSRVEIALDNEYVVEALLHPREWQRYRDLLDKIQGL
ncbi:unnamed protein product [Arabis nemorensis]|uniref:Uncharacterized protein n=1 Tax=Arabis nemorensis TaxID=586526 RepID=A0A565BGR1_9BRAS|nr:unnamed protein product [Arabis nemorensis]